MKKIALLLVLAVSLISVSSCSKRVLKGEGPIISETRSLADFDQIYCNGSIDLEVVASNRDEVTISGYQNLVPAYRTDVSSGKLYLEYDDEYINIRHDNLKVTVYTTGFEKLKLSGSGDVAIKSGINSDYMNIQISGSGNVRLTHNTFKTLITKINGSGNIYARDADSDEVYATISGSGDISVTALDLLDARISGSGDIDYWGNPASVTVDVSGSGRVRKH